MRHFDPFNHQESTDMVLTDEQKEIILKAIALLSPFDKTVIPRVQHYFTDGEDGDDLCIEVCDDETCVAAVLKDNPNANTITWFNDGDHEKIEICEICGKKLNSYLTWIDTEFEYLSENVRTKKEIKSHAFDLIVVFDSYPSADERIGGYERHQAQIGNIQPLNDKLLAQEDHVNRVISYAEFIIKMLSPKKVN